MQVKFTKSKGERGFKSGKWPEKKEIWRFFSPWILKEVNKQSSASVERCSFIKRRFHFICFCHINTGELCVSTFLFDYLFVAQFKRIFFGGGKVSL